MIFQECDIPRIMGVFISQIIITISFLYFFVRIRSRSKSRYSKILSTIYIIVVLAFTLNFIYVWFTIPILITILDFLMIYLLFVAFILMIFFILNLLYSIKIFLISIQLKIAAVYCVATFLAMFLPTIIGPNIIVINNKPKYLWPLSITLYIFLIVAFVIPTLFFSMKVYHTITKPDLKKRWQFFNLGYLLLCIGFICLITFVTIEDEIIRYIISFIGLIIVNISGYFMYYGVIKSLK